jgi:hypothetical protein
MTFNEGDESMFLQSLWSRHSIRGAFLTISKTCAWRTYLREQ